MGQILPNTSSLLCILFMAYLNKGGEGADYAHPIATPSGFSDLPLALKMYFSFVYLSNFWCYLRSELAKTLRSCFVKLKARYSILRYSDLFLRKFGENQQFSPSWMDWACWKSLDCSCTVQQTWIGGFFHLSWCKCQLNSTFKPSNKSEYWSGLTKKFFFGLK